MSEALSFRGVTKRYGGVTAVFDVDLEIIPGEVFGIVGPNGAGKSTLVDIASGFTKATEGSVWLGDRQLSGRSPHAVASHRVARTFQHTSLFGEYSVRKNLQIAAAARRSTSERAVDEAMRLAGLEADADVLSESLPYGAQRRLAVAIALTMDPKVLLLDEPAAGMNPVESAEFVQFVQAIQSGRTIVLIEHDMSVVRALCERTAVMVDGALLTVGVTETVLREPEVIEVYLGVPT